jgi:hypothetical protein
MAFTRDSLRALRATLDVALTQVGATHGVALSIGTLTFTGDRATARLTLLSAAPVAPMAMPATPTLPEVDPVEAERARFAAFASRLGLLPDDYGKSVRLSGRAFTLCGIKPDSPVYPVIARSERGTSYKFPLDETLRALGRAPTMPPMAPPAPAWSRGGDGEHAER